MEKYIVEKVDLNKKTSAETFSEISELPSAASITLALGALAVTFAQVERVPRYTEEHRENDAEHSFMLALVANELAALLYPELDAGRVTQFAIVHDLIEIVTGDVPTFTYTPEQMATKHAAEHTALNGLVQTLPRSTASLLWEYEQQEVAEARFVKAVDKLLPVTVDIL